MAKKSYGKINKYIDGYYTKIFDNKVCVGKSKRLTIPQRMKTGDFSVDKCAKGLLKNGKVKMDYHINGLCIYLKDLFLNIMNVLL